MGEWLNGFVDLSPSSWIGGPGLRFEGRGLVLLYVALTFGLPAAVFAAQALHRRAQARGASRRSELIAGDRLREGWATVVEVPSSRSVRRLHATISSIDRRYVALSLHGGGAASSVPVGTPLRLFVVGDTAAYWFAAAAQGAATSKDAELLYVERPGWIEKVQRREHFRVRLRLPATLSTVAAEPAQSVMLRGAVLDLSAGGFRIGLPAALPVGARVRLRIIGGELGVCSYEARVVSCAEMLGGGELRFQVRCELLPLAPEQRDNLVARCFDLQRRLMRGDEV